jgi:hypothetical protein
MQRTLPVIVSHLGLDLSAVGIPAALPEFARPDVF